MKPAADMILLAHGGGGLKTRELIQSLILRHLGNPILATLSDSAIVALPGGALAFTTDSYVITPLFFPGGDIGRLSVCGTVNDLVMQGARPLYLSLGLILEEGLPMADLDRIVQSLAATAHEAGVSVVTGDTKVVERGKGNGVFINTAGIGVPLPSLDLRARNVRPGDAVIVTGTLGDHGAAIIATRESLSLSTPLVSDAAPLWSLLQPVLDPALNLRWMRDPTRGGAATALCDLAESVRLGIRIREKTIPIRPAVTGICRLLGLDPLTVANEGKAILVCAEQDRDPILARLRRHPLGRHAECIGQITDAHPGLVVLETAAGGERIVEMPVGENLPRIC